MGRTHVKTAYRARIRQSLSLLLAAVLILALLPLSAKADKQPGRTPIGRSDHGFTDLPASAQSGQPWINGQAGILVELNTGTVPSSTMNTPTVPVFIKPKNVYPLS